MMWKTVLGLAIGMIAFNVQAATWYGFTGARGDHSIYFFDLDTVIKQPGSVTIWVKSVRSEKWPDSDGAYSTASKDTYSCTNRTVQTLVEVNYGLDQRHLSTKSKPGKASDIIPDSVAETIWKTVCMKGFPDSKSKDYVRVGDNDIYAATKRILDAEDDPAPK